MSTVYVLRYSLPYDGSDMVSVYANFQGVLHRLEMARLYDNFDEGETFTIECMEVTSEETALERLERVREHFAKKEKKESK